MLPLLLLILAALVYGAIGLYLHSKTHESQDVVQGLMSIVLWPLLLAGELVGQVLDRAFAWLARRAESPPAQR